MSQARRVPRAFLALVALSVVVIAMFVAVQRRFNQFWPTILSELHKWSSGSEAWTRIVVDILPVIACLTVPVITLLAAYRLSPRFDPRQLIVFSLALGLTLTALLPAGIASMTRLVADLFIGLVAVVAFAQAIGRLNDDHAEWEVRTRSRWLDRLLLMSVPGSLLFVAVYAARSDSVNPDLVVAVALLLAACCWRQLATIRPADWPAFYQQRSVSPADACGVGLRANGASPTGT